MSLSNMPRNKTLKSSTLESRLLGAISGIRHGFGTRKEPISGAFTPLWQDAKKPQWKQVHGTACAEVKHPAQACGEVDGLWSRESASAIAVVTADCVPILLARRDGSAVAAVHAGWRGTQARILEKLFREHLIPAGEKPWNWIAAIGPCAKPCCYEVSPELADEFKKNFGEIVVPKPRKIDLVRSNVLQLEALGIEEVDTQTAHCTICTRDDAGQFAFHSYRRDGSGGRQFSLISRVSE
jgi:YfiH family protein